jgi:hypothetical protein
VQDIRSRPWYAERPARALVAGGDGRGVSRVQAIPGERRAPRRRSGAAEERESAMGTNATTPDASAAGAVADQAANERFEDVAAALSGRPGFGRGAMFGAPVLKVDGKVLAALRDGKLVLKLPPDRIGALIAGGQGEPFTAYGKTMREWVAVPVAAADRWPDLAEEALAFVRPR